MWFKEEIRNPAAPQEKPTYIRFGIGKNPRKGDLLDVLVPKKFKEALRDSHAVTDDKTFKLLLEQLMQKYGSRWIPIVQRNKKRNFWLQGD
jgi:hypothetical protein